MTKSRSSCSSASATRSAPSGSRSAVTTTRLTSRTVAASSSAAVSHWILETSSALCRRTEVAVTTPSTCSGRPSVLGTTRQLRLSQRISPVGRRTRNSSSRRPNACVDGSTTDISACMSSGRACASRVSASPSKSSGAMPTSSSRVSSASIRPVSGTSTKEPTRRLRSAGPSSADAPGRPVPAWSTPPTASAYRSRKRRCSTSNPSDEAPTTTRQPSRLPSAPSGSAASDASARGGTGPPSEYEASAAPSSHSGRSPRNACAAGEPPDSPNRSGSPNSDVPHPAVSASRSSSLPPFPEPGTYTAASAAPANVSARSFAAPSATGGRRGPASAAPAPDAPNAPDIRSSETPVRARPS